MIYFFLANGFEESEALVTYDMLCRAGLKCLLVGVESEFITGSHGVTVKCQIKTDQLKGFNDMDALVLPGGMPGTTNLKNNSTVSAAIDFAAQNGRVMGAICAAPSILGEKGLLKGKKATCYPGFEDKLTGAVLQDAQAVCDGDIITGRSAGAVYQFGFRLIERLIDTKTAVMVKESMICTE